MNSAVEAAIRRQVPEDAAAVRDVIGRAFHAQPGVGALEQALAQRHDSTGYVALVDDRVAGHVRLTRGWIDAEARLVEVLYLSPLSVAPEWQSRGIGRALVAHAVVEAKRSGVPAVFLEGDPGYYGRLGWRPASELGVAPPSARIPEPGCQVVSLPGWEPWMRGTLVYADTFWALDFVGLRGDRLAEARESLANGAASGSRAQPRDAPLERPGERLASTRLAPAGFAEDQSFAREVPLIDRWNWTKSFGAMVVTGGPWQPGEGRRAG